MLALVLLVDLVFGDASLQMPSFPLHPTPLLKIMEPTQDLVPPSSRVPSVENPAHSIRK